MPRTGLRQEPAADHSVVESLGTQCWAVLTRVPKCSAHKARMLMESPPEQPRPVDGLFRDIGHFRPGLLLDRDPQVGPDLQRAFLHLEHQVFCFEGPSLDAAMQEVASFGRSSIRPAQSLMGSVNLMTGFAIGNVVGLVHDVDAVPELVGLLEKSGSIYLAYQAGRALVSIGGPEAQRALRDLAGRSQGCTFTHDIAASLLALLETPLLFTISSGAFDDELVRSVFSPWDEFIRMSSANLMSLAQPLEYLYGAGVLGRDRVTQTVWRAVRAERCRSLEASGGVR